MTTEDLWEELHEQDLKNNLRECPVHSTSRCPVCNKIHIG